MSKESRRRQRMAGQASGTGPGAKIDDARGSAERPGGGRPSSPSHRPRPSTIEQPDRTPTRRPARARASGRPRVVPPALPPLAARGGRRRRRRCGRCGRVRSGDPAGVRVLQHLGTPAPTASPAADASPQPGYVQPDMGNTHVASGTVVKYTYCPPASGRHYYQPRRRRSDPRPPVWSERRRHPRGLGPQPRARRAGDPVQAAPRWTRRRSARCTTRSRSSPVCGFQPGGNSPGPVVARFDDMAWPYAALVWDRVLPLRRSTRRRSSTSTPATARGRTRRSCCDASASPSVRRQLHRRRRAASPYPVREREPDGRAERVAGRVRLAELIGRTGCGYMLYRCRPAGRARSSMGCLDHLTAACMRGRRRDGSAELDAGPGDRATRQDRLCRTELRGPRRGRRPAGPGSATALLEVRERRHRRRRTDRPTRGHPRPRPRGRARRRHRRSRPAASRPPRRWTMSPATSS